MKKASVEMICPWGFYRLKCGQKKGGKRRGGVCRAERVRWTKWKKRWSGEERKEGDGSVKGNRREEMRCRGKISWQWTEREIHSFIHVSSEKNENRRWRRLIQLPSGLFPPPKSSKPRFTKQLLFVHFNLTTANDSADPGAWRSENHGDV